MRFDSNVKFFSEKGSRYDPVVGDYVSENKQVAEVIANVTDVGTDRAQMLFGDLATQHKVVRIVCPVGYDWSYCLIDDDDTKYIPTTTRSPLKAQTFIVGEKHG